MLALLVWKGMRAAGVLMWQGVMRVSKRGVAP
jgi:hypothetical protein